MQVSLRKFGLLIAIFPCIEVPVHAAFVYDVTVKGIAAVYECNQNSPDYPICPIFKGYREFTSNIYGPGSVPGMPSIRLYSSNEYIGGSWNPPFESMVLNFDFSAMGLGPLNVGVYDLYGTGLLQYESGRSYWTRRIGYIETARLIVTEVPDQNAFLTNAKFSFGLGAPAPEPSTWAMMIAGFGMVGAAIRRKDRKPDLLPD